MSFPIDTTKRRSFETVSDSFFVCSGCGAGALNPRRLPRLRFGQKPRINSAIKYRQTGRDFFVGDSVNLGKPRVNVLRVQRRLLQL